MKTADEALREAYALGWAAAMREVQTIVLTFGETQLSHDSARELVRVLRSHAGRGPSIASRRCKSEICGPSVLDDREPAWKPCSLAEGHEGDCQP